LELNLEWNDVICICLQAALTGKDECFKLDFGIEFGDENASNRHNNKNI
jgi:hypothetical protein